MSDVAMNKWQRKIDASRQQCMDDGKKRKRKTTKHDKTKQHLTQPGVKLSSVLRSMLLRVERALRPGLALNIYTYWLMCLYGNTTKLDPAGDETKQFIMLLGVLAPAEDLPFSRKSFTKAFVNIMSMCLTKRTRKHKQIFDCSIPSHVPS